MLPGSRVGRREVKKEREEINKECVDRWVSAMSNWSSILPDTFWKTLGYKHTFKLSYWEVRNLGYLCIKSHCSLALPAWPTHRLRILPRPEWAWQRYRKLSFCMGIICRWCPGQAEGLLVGHWQCLIELSFQTGYKAWNLHAFPSPIYSDLSRILTFPVLKKGSQMQQQQQKKATAAGHYPGPRYRLWIPSSLSSPTVYFFSYLGGIGRHIPAYF